MDNNRISDLNDGDMYATDDERFIGWLEYVILEINFTCGRAVHYDPTLAEAMRHMHERGFTAKAAADVVMRQSGWIESTTNN